MRGLAQFMGGWMALACWAGTAVPGAAQAPATNAPAAPAGLPAFLLVEKDDEPKEIFILGRRDPELLYRAPNSPPGVSAGLAFNKIRGVEFMMQFDEARMYGHVRSNQWLQAAQVILPFVTPTLPYLDLPNNNAMDPALQSGIQLLRAADLARRAGATNAPAFYQAAQRIFAAAGKAEWHPGFEGARARVVLCLIRQEQMEEARKAFADLREPDLGDQAFGVYWLVAGELRFAEGNLNAAMDAAIRSVSFENKDIDCFPDALQLTARLYEELNEWHRARDVNYEVARLFRPPVWSDEARGRLQGIMTGGQSRVKEDPNLVGLFFGTEEDMNAAADALLKGGTEEDLPDAPDSKNKNPGPAETKEAGPTEDAK